MTLGIVSFGGIFLCGITLLLAPLAWFLGARVIREIDADRFASPAVSGPTPSASWA